MRLQFSYSVVTWMLMMMMSVTSLSSQSCDIMMNKDVKAAQTIWYYMLMNHTLPQCDVIVALGSYDVRVARWAADLWLKGEGGQWLVMSGDTGNLTKNLWTRPEADIFRDVAVGRGVPREKILVERESTNTGENVQLTHRLLSHLGISASCFLLVQKPYMERRAHATFLAQWPKSTIPADVFVTSPDVTLLDYPNDDVGSLSDVISVMLGDMQRILLYGELGFQKKQFVPREVMAAFEYLRDTGRYNDYFQ